MPLACLDPRVPRRPRKALVIEGGGMKAAFANGVLSAFEEAGLGKWDAVYGTSAGGALAAWYSAGQAVFAEQTWKYARDARILDYRRALLGRPFLDHAALIDLVYAREHPLDVARVQAAKWPVVVTAADVDAGTCTYQDLRRGDVLLWLKATGRLPLGAGPPVEIAGRRYVDGGVLDPMPLRRAVDDGAREVVAVFNEPVGPRRADPRFIAGLAARRYPRLRDGIVRHHLIKEEALAFGRTPPEGTVVHVVAPPHPTGLHRITRDLDRLRAAIGMGREAGRAFLGREDRAG